jgi:MFS family permease
MLKHKFSSDVAVNRSLHHSLKDACAFAVMSGIGDSYLSAFALFLGAGTAQIGLLASLPPMLASLVQLVSARLGRAEGWRKRLILIGASVQAISWLPLLFLPLLFPLHSISLLIVCAIVLQAGGHLAVPQWSSLIGDIIPRRKRGRFFGIRTQLITALSFAALLAGGLVLHMASEQDATIYGFMILFVAAALARMISVYHLARMHDPGGKNAALSLLSAVPSINRLLHSNAARFSAFFAFASMATWISAPFFTVYLLRDLGYNYLEFTLVIGTAVAVQFLTMSQWGRISDVFGNRRILAVSSLFIPLVPALWLVSTNIAYVLMIQVLSGFCWAGFSLSANNFVYDLVKPENRAPFLAIHNVLANAGIFAGSIIGGVLGAMMPATVSVASFDWAWASPLYGVFLLSAVLRGLVVLIFMPRIREVRNVKPISTGQVIFRVARIHALAGLVFETIGMRSRRRD